MENQQQIQEKINKLNEQFSEFLHAKGFKTKFKLAISNISENTAVQHQKDKQNFNEIKQKSIEENKEFVELLHTKGFKAKCRLIIENIKKSAKESRQKSSNALSQTSTNIQNEYQDMSKEQLVEQLNEFLKTKELDTEYSIVIK